MACSLVIDQGGAKSQTTVSGILSAPGTKPQITGVRFPWDIPVEDYLFGYSMVTLTIMLWVHWGRRHEEVAGGRP